MKISSTLLMLTAVVWLGSCSQPKEQKEVEQPLQPTINYEGVSLVVMEETKKTLGGELKAAMERGGVSEAVDYCNVHALLLTDSIGKRYAATVKRVTDKPRNAANAATEAELKQLEQWRSLIAAGDQRVVTAEETEEARNFYMPIKIEALCLNCHGIPGETLTPENQALIAAKYPNDMATGYQLGELRGLWHISFKK